MPSYKPIKQNRSTTRHKVRTKNDFFAQKKLRDQMLGSQKDDNDSSEYEGSLLADQQMKRRKLNNDSENQNFNNLNDKMLNFKIDENASEASSQEIGSKKSENDLLS